MASIFRDIRLGVLAFAALAAVSVLGQLATYPNLRPWYAELQKPAFNPPDWVFPPVWTTLYLLMAFALWRVLRRPASGPRSTALALFAVLLGLNAAWSWMFFAAHSPGLGLINIVPQLVVIVATILSFRRVETLAAACLVPLAAWVAYAALLNAAIWHLNR